VPFIYEADMGGLWLSRRATSLHAMNQAIEDSRVRSALSRAALRIIDHVPAFRRVIYNRMDDE
jgi:hypothetical protein